MERREKVKAQGENANKASKQRVVKPILIIIGIILFKSLIWDVYIVNPTVEAALEGLEGEAGGGTYISEDETANLTIQLLADGFKVYGVSKGYWGWSVTDEISIKHHGGDASIEVTEKTFHYKGEKDVKILLITTKDNRIDRVIAESARAKKIAFNRIVNREIQLYYSYSEEPLGEVTYKAFSADGKILYTQ